MSKFITLPEKDIVVNVDHIVQVENIIKRPRFVLEPEEEYVFVLELYIRTTVRSIEYCTESVKMKGKDIKIENHPEYDRFKSIRDKILNELTRNWDYS